MDAKKTGALIAQARKERNLTQKQLAEALHISDRTVSKWERGAGFPDVTLLSPLADALEISVVALLQGDKDSDPSLETSMRNAIKIIYQQTKNKFKRNFLSILSSVILALFFCGFAYVVLEYNGVFLKEVSLEVPVNIYEDAQLVDSSTIYIDGKRGKYTFSGTFAIEYVEKTTRPQVQGYIRWGDTPGSYDSIDFWGYGGPFDCGLEQICYISSDMQSMAMKMDDGTVIATDEALMQLIMLGSYYPLDF